MTVRVNGKVVTPSGVIRQGCVEVRGDRISAVAEYPSVRDGHWIVPGFVDIHTHGGGGHTFTTGDADSLAEAAAALLDDPARRKELSKAARSAVRAYDWSTVARDVLHVYETVAAGAIGVVESAPR